MMAVDRFKSAGNPHLIVVATLLCTVTVMSACVSVQESGNQQAPPPATGVDFHSSPDNAEVFVNGEFRGSAPVRLNLAAGTHKIMLRLPGFKTWERELVVVAGDETRVSARLERE
jgi:hypothetical protein